MVTDRRLAKVPDFDWLDLLKEKIPQDMPDTAPLCLGETADFLLDDLAVDCGELHPE
jgi:hypothetical protein